MIENLGNFVSILCQSETRCITNQFVEAVILIEDYSEARSVVFSDCSSARCRRTALFPHRGSFQYHRQTQREELALEGRASGRGDHLRAGDVAVCGVLRAGALAVPAGTDAHCGDQLRGRYPFAAGQRAAGGAVRGDGADVPVLGDPELGELVDHHPRPDPVRGHHQRV